MSLEANQIATKGDLAEMLQSMKELLATAPAAGSLVGDEYLTIDEVAQLTRFNRKTVTKWIEQGKYDHQGKIVKLFTLEFAPGFPRIPRSALIAYGQAVGFDTSHLLTAPTMWKAAS